MCTPLSIMDNEVKSAYVDKRTNASFAGLPAFLQNSKFKNYKEVQKLLSGLEAYSLHRQAKVKIKQRRRIKAFWMHYQYSIDLWDIRKFNDKKYSYVLLAVDNFSKKCWYTLLKDKSGNEVLRGLKSVMRDSGHYPEYIVADEVTVFNNVHV